MKLLTRDGRNGTLGPAEAIDLFGKLAGEGFDQVIFSMQNMTEPEPFDVLASSVIPEVEKMPVAGR